MGVLEPSGNGLYLLPQHLELPTAETTRDTGSRVALTAQCDHVLWHRRFGHLTMQSPHAHHRHGGPTSHVLACSLKSVSCDSCLLHKATVAPRNTTSCAKPSRPLLNMSFDLLGPINVPSPHGFRYCLLVIDHHTHYMWVWSSSSIRTLCLRLLSPVKCALAWASVCNSLPSMPITW
jgi:hypothetical protein